MRVIIAEKPSVASAIAGAFAGPGKPDGASFRLLNGDHVTWLYGHMLRLSDPEDHDPALQNWSWETLPLSWPIEHRLRPEVQAHYHAVVALAFQADELIHAGDPDAEGQRLVDEVIEHAGLGHKPCWRVLLPDLNPDPIRHAFAQMQDNRRYHALSQSALARAVCDQRYGYNLTRAYTLAAQARGSHSGVISVGRVQTPILGLVVARDAAHEQHRPQPYYRLWAQLRLPQGGEAITVEYLPTEDGFLDDEGRVIDRAHAQAIAADLSQAQSARVRHCASYPVEQAAPLLYNLLALQADAAGLYGYGPRQVMEITQALRERHGAITYNRSDCRYAPPPRAAEAQALLRGLERFLPAAADAQPEAMGRAFDSARIGAHHAIIPTARVPSAEALTLAERRVYDLIARLYVAQFFPSAQWSESEVIFDLYGHRFMACGRQPAREGWQRVVLAGQCDDGTPLVDPLSGAAAQALAALVRGEGLVIEASGCEALWTPAPPRYRMQTLLRDLAQVAKYVQDPQIRGLLLAKDREKADEWGGLGTPATRDSILETLFRRGFLAQQGEDLSATAAGRALFQALPAVAVQPDLTALWHQALEQVAQGQASAAQVIAEVEAFIAAEVARVRPRC